MVFPVPKEEFSLTPVFEEPLAHIKIPAELLETRANETSELAKFVDTKVDSQTPYLTGTTRVFAVNMVIENINELLGDAG